MDKIGLIEKLIEKTKAVKYKDSSALDAITREAKLVIKKIFSNDSDYLKEIDKTTFYAPFNIGMMQDSIYLKAWETGRSTYINIFKSMIMDLEFDVEELDKGDKQKTITAISKDVFVVHGHNEEMKQAVARTLEKLGLNPVILHEKADGGRSIKSKFEEEGFNAMFAIILFSPDDMGYAVKEGEKTAQYRARQNVIYELGYFMGRLNKGNVIVLRNAEKDIELPNDIHGVLYKTYDNTGGWKLELVKEFKAAGYEVDANKLY